MKGVHWNGTETKSLASYNQKLNHIHSCVIKGGQAKVVLSNILCEV